MSGTSRHKACKCCRDRKVRCNGEQPTCEKCQRSGETCVYSPTNSPSKADLAQTIEILQGRIATTEAFITKQTQPMKASSNNQPTAAPVPDSIPNFENFTYSPTNMQSPFSRDSFKPSGPHRNASQPISQFYDSLDNDFLNCLPSPHITVRNDLFASQFPIYDLQPTKEETYGINHLTSLHLRGSEHCPLQMPSLREIRVLNSSSSSSTASPVSNSNGDRGEQGDNSLEIIKELTNFSSVIFATQAEIAGISSVVAEYLAWVRKSPPGAARGLPGVNCDSVLETLEMRVWELHDMAETRHRAAWKQMVNVLEKFEGVAMQLSESERELMKRAAGKAKFFEADYDVCVPMQEQKAEI